MVQVQMTTAKWLLIFGRALVKSQGINLTENCTFLPLADLNSPFVYNMSWRVNLEKGANWSRRCRCLMNVTDCKGSTTMLYQHHLVSGIVVLNCPWLEKAQGMSLAKNAHCTLTMLGVTILSINTDPLLQSLQNGTNQSKVTLKYQIKVSESVC